MSWVTPCFYFHEKRFVFTKRKLWMNVLFLFFRCIFHSMKRALLHEGWVGFERPYLCYLSEMSVRGKMYVNQIRQTKWYPSSKRSFTFNFNCMYYIDYLFNYYNTAHIDSSNKLKCTNLYKYYWIIIIS